MDQKQKTLIVLKTLFESSGNGINQSYVQEKIDACFDLANPAILLSQEEAERYKKTVEDYRREGKII